MPFGRYLIRERIAQGGMGEVFFAVAVGADGFEKPVVIKRLLPKFAGRADIVSLLAREAKLMTRLIHPNIVQVIDFGARPERRLLLVMELVGGADLGRFWPGPDRERRTPARAPGPVHRDPDAEGARLRPRHGFGRWQEARAPRHQPGQCSLVDVRRGENRRLWCGPRRKARPTRKVTMGGSSASRPTWHPSSLARGAVDERADIYSVGAVLFKH